MGNQGLELYVKSLEKRISHEKETIAQLNWWKSAQEDYGISNGEGVKEIDDDLRVHNDIVLRYEMYLKEAKEKLGIE